MRTKAFRLLCRSVLPTLLLIGAPDRSTAKDLDASARFVTPAYTAMNFTAVCAGRDSQFLAQTTGPRGTAFHYAEHVKNEAIESLTQDEAVAALKAAADAARTIALQTFRRLSASDPSSEARQIRSWCEGDGREFVRKFIQEHDDNHTVLLLELKESQR